MRSIFTSVRASMGGGEGWQGGLTGLHPLVGGVFQYVF